MPPIDAAQHSPAELQQRLQELRLTEPKLVSAGPTCVAVWWSDAEVEYRYLSPYEYLLVKAVGRVGNASGIGFETGEWPDGKGWYGHLGWKRAIWLGLRKGEFDELDEQRVRSTSTQVDSAAGQREARS